MWCEDPVLTSLKAIGYNAVRLPKADLRPLQIMTQGGRDLHRLGELATVLVPGKVPVPLIIANVPAAAITVRRTGRLRLGVGLTVLSNVLQVMGGSAVGLDAQYRRASAVELEFRDVLIDSVDVAALDQYLTAADVNPFSRQVTELLESDAIYVTTATIKSQRLAVEALASSGGAVEVSGPAVQDVVGATVTVSPGDRSASELTYEGKTPLIFGFQAVRLYYRDGRYTAFRVLPPEGGLISQGGQPGGADDPVDRFVSERAFIRVTEDV